MKKALGMVLDSKKITMALIEESNGKLSLLNLKDEVLGVPDNSDDADEILATMSAVRDIIETNKITEVYFLKAGTTPQGKGASSARIKAEASVQIAARELDIKVDAISPQTLKAAQKKVEKYNEKSIDEVLGKKFSSQVKREAAEIALLGLSRNRK